MARPKNVAIIGYNAKIFYAIDGNMTITGKNIVLANIQERCPSVYKCVGGNSH